MSADIHPLRSTRDIGQLTANYTLHACCIGDKGAIGEVAGVIDAMRQIAIEENCASPEAAKIVAFQKAFLRSVRKNGRTNELEMVADFEIRHFLSRFELMGALKDATLGPKMLGKKKLHFKLGSPVKDKAIVKRIFDKCGVKI